jgi:anoctamin-8
VLNDSLLFKAAEIAAKKSRLKQKLVKSARSVAIFSLKLKERRAREAERQAQEKLEDARVSYSRVSSELTQ